MSKKILLIILFLLAIILSVLFFTGYFPKFQVVGPVTWYFRNDLTLSASSTSSETYVSARVPSTPIYFGIEFLAGSRTLRSIDIQQFSTYVYPATTFTYSIKFNATINLNEDVKIKLYFRTASSRFLEVTFSSGILKSGWFSVDGVLQYKIWFMWNGSYDEVRIYYGTTDEYLNGISYFILDFYDADLSIYVKSVSITVKAKLEVISETPLIQNYNLEGDYDFNAVFRVRDSCTKFYTNDFDVKSINLTDSSLNVIPLEWYKENFSIYVKAKVYKFYGKAEDKSLKLFFELSSVNYLDISYSLTIKMVKPVIVIYMLDEKGQVVKSFVKGTNTFYLKFQGVTNLDPRDINLTVIDPHGVKRFVSAENIVPSEADTVRVTYNFEEVGTYVFLVDYHDAIETSQTFTYQVVEPYNFFRWDNPLFVAFVVVIIAVIYSLVKRKKE